MCCDDEEPVTFLTLTHKTQMSDFRYVFIHMTFFCGGLVASSGESPAVYPVNHNLTAEVDRDKHSVMFCFHDFIEIELKFQVHLDGNQAVI